jgi:transcriptional regulator with XRE-family HTH domain
MRMSDASNPGEDWAGYLRRMTNRSGWSVARLSRDSGVHRGTIFKWMSGKGGVTLASVRSIAAALGDDPTNALRAAGSAGGAPLPDADEELDLIMAADVDNQTKQVMVERLLERRERERQARIADLQFMIDQARRPEAG